MTPAELREWRTARGLSQEELAKLVGRSRRTVIYWEQGADIPHWLPAILEATERKSK